VVSDTLDVCAVAPEVVEQRLAQRRIGDLRLYNPAMHSALFALPNFYRELLPA
jgi:spermidine synthase